MTVQIYLVLGLAWLLAVAWRLSRNAVFKAKLRHTYVSTLKEHGKAVAVISLYLGIFIAAVLRVLAWPVYVLLYVLKGGSNV